MDIRTIIEVAKEKKVLATVFVHWQSGFGYFGCKNPLSDSFPLVAFVYLHQEERKKNSEKLLEKTKEKAAEKKEEISETLEEKKEQ